MIVSVLKRKKAYGSYNEMKDMFYETCDDYDRYSFSKDKDVFYKTAETFHLDFPRYIDANGMDKFCFVMARFFYELEKAGNVNMITAAAALCDISQFSTGDYDDLFSKKDLELIHKDMEFIEDYVANHPDLEQQVIEFSEKDDSRFIFT